MLKQIIAALAFGFLPGLGYCQGDVVVDGVATMLAPGIISGPVHEAAPAFSPDGNTVYFFRRGPALTGVILESHQSNGKWSKPVIASFSGRWQDIEPAMSPDGAYMIFASNRPVAEGGKVLNGTWNGQHFAGGGGNLWRVDRKGGGARPSLWGKR